MNYTDKVPDSKNPSEDQKKNGFFIESGKYFLEETRGKGTRTKELSNFVMQSVFHLNNGTNNSKRIIKIQRYTGETKFIEVYSSEMKLATFETILKSNRCTFIGGIENLNLIFSRLMDEESEAFYIDVLGYIPEHNIYAFADSIITQSNLVEKVNELGIIYDTKENKSYYLPSFGIANINDASHDTNRLYSFRPGNLTFQNWAKYYFQSFESNGIIGILFLILSIFRDIVFNQLGSFPFLFLFGDFGTGKTSFVEFLLAVFGKDTIGVALNNATITALSRIVSPRFNSLFYFKEYTSDTDESAQDFILTAYDGAGRTTGVKSNDNRTQSLVIKSAIILDGNELPVEKSAVLSRMILAFFQKQNFSNEQKEAFDKLKDEAEFGLGNVLLNILKHRDLFAKQFKPTFSQILKDLKYSGDFSNFHERMLKHMALLLTPVKIEGYVITAKPPNPIYDAGAAPVREYYGTGFHDLTDIFKYISIIKETNLHIHLIKNDKLKKTGTYLKYRLKKGLKVAVTPFKGDITFEFDSRLKKWPGNEKTPYWFKKIENIEAAKTWLIEKVLQPCVEKEVDILVLPELTVDEKLIVFFKDWLKTNNRERVSSGNGGLLLVAAGTFHFLGQDKKRLNVATVLNHAGEVVWMQNKIKRFSLDASDIKKKPDLKELLKISSAGGCECIDETDTICCADTPVGRISVCICIDFFHREHLEAYRQSGINIFLVPAMTPRNIRFLKTAGLLAGNNLAAAFVSNSGYAAKKENSSIHKDGASFYFLPRKGERGVFAVGEDSDLLIFDMKS